MKHLAHGVEMDLLRGIEIAFDAHRILPASSLDRHQDCMRPLPKPLAAMVAWKQNYRCRAEGAHVLPTPAWKN